MGGWVLLARGTPTQVCHRHLLSLGSHLSEAGTRGVAGETGHSLDGLGAPSTPPPSSSLRPSVLSQLPGLLRLPVRVGESATRRTPGRTLLGPGVTALQLKDLKLNRTLKTEFQTHGKEGTGPGLRPEGPWWGGAGGTLRHSCRGSQLRRERRIPRCDSPTRSEGHEFSDFPSKGGGWQLPGPLPASCRAVRTEDPFRHRPREKSSLAHMLVGFKFPRTYVGGLNPSSELQGGVRPAGGSGEPRRCPLRLASPHTLIPPENTSLL